MGDYLTGWLENEAEEGGFARYRRALKPNSAHQGTRKVWGQWFGLRIDYDAELVTFTEMDEESGVTMSLDEARQVLGDAQDKLMGR